MLYTGSDLPTAGSGPSALVCQKVYLIFEPRAALETDLEAAKGISMAAAMKSAGTEQEAWQGLEGRLSGLLRWFLLALSASDPAQAEHLKRGPFLLCGH